MSVNKLSCPSVQGTGPFAGVFLCVMPLTSLPWASFGRSHGKEARDCRRRQESIGLFLAQSWVSFVAWGNFVTFLHISEPWFPHLKKRIGGHKQSLELKIHSFLKVENFFTVMEPAESWFSWELNQLIPWDSVLSFSFTPLYLDLAG